MTIGFVFAVLATPWPDWFKLDQVAPELQLAGDLLVLSPFFATTLVLWILAFPAERATRSGDPIMSGVSQDTASPWRLGNYLDFNVRHHLLVVAVPLTAILFGANVIRGREDQIRHWTGVWWSPDILLGMVAGAVFLFAPLMLIRIWRTSPIEQGPLRTKLEDVCKRINLRVRDILVWNSDGLMINAAVMGVIPQVRYVLLSDALLESMSDDQVEAVFGHEAGHVRHHHITHFLLFAFVGWIVVAGIMELLAYVSLTTSAIQLSLLTIQSIGVATTLIIWGVGFGWLSRRFERQADTFGAYCVTPNAAQCHLPCAVHRETETESGNASIPQPRDHENQPLDHENQSRHRKEAVIALSLPDERPPDQASLSPSENNIAIDDDLVCATGANIFASALERVALLNGIPREEKSWRHSSIAYRVRFLRSLAADPVRAKRFQRLVKRAKRTLLVLSLLGATASFVYWKWVPQPALLRIQTGVATANVVSPR